MIIRSAIAAGLWIVGVLPAGAKDCSPAATPPGVRVQLPPGCAAPPPQWPMGASPVLPRPGATPALSISATAHR